MFVHWLYTTLGVVQVCAIWQVYQFLPHIVIENQKAILCSLHCSKHTFPEDSMLKIDKKSSTGEKLNSDSQYQKQRVDFRAASLVEDGANIV